MERENVSWFSTLRLEAPSRTKINVGHQFNLIVNHWLQHTSVSQCSKPVLKKNLYQREVVHERWTNNSNTGTPTLVKRNHLLPQHSRVQLVRVGPRFLSEQSEYVLDL
jgi:hypothetical protein